MFGQMFFSLLGTLIVKPFKTILTVVTSTIKWTKKEPLIEEKESDHEEEVNENEACDRLALDYLKRYSVLIDDVSPKVHKLTGWKRRRPTEKGQLRRWELGEAVDGEHRTLLIAGDPPDTIEWINGLFNHVVRVDWSDPFRFEIMRDDNCLRNLALTVHKKSGMAIGYSITFVVTPIANFAKTLNELDDVHGVCFVSSTDSDPGVIDELKRLLGCFDHATSSNVKWIVTSHDGSATHPDDHEDELPIEVLHFYNGVLYEDNTAMSYEGGHINVDYDQRLFNWRQQSQRYDAFFTNLNAMERKRLDEAKRISLAIELIKEHSKEIDLLLDKCKIKKNALATLDRKMKAIRDQVQMGEAYYMKQMIGSTVQKKYLPTGWYTYHCMKCSTSCERVDADERSGIEKKIPAFWRRCSSTVCQCAGHRHTFKSVEIRRVSQSSPSLMHSSQLKQEYDEKCRRLEGLGHLSDGIRDELSATEDRLLVLIGNVSNHLGTVRTASVYPAPTGAGKSVLDILDEAFDRCQTPLPSPALSAPRFDADADADDADDANGSGRIDYRDELIYRLKEWALVSGVAS